VAVFWPASGIAAAILIVSGRRARPTLVVGVVVGTVAANLMSDRSLLTSLLKGVCNAGEAVLVAWLLEQWFDRPFRFDDLRRLAGFLVVACLAAAASAAGGAATMTLSHTEAPYWDVWRAWFSSDCVGIVLVAPLMIGLAQAWREPPSRREWIEEVGVLGLATLASSSSMSHETASWLSSVQSRSYCPSCCGSRPAASPLSAWLARLSRQPGLCWRQRSASAALVMRPCRSWSG
jgi:integral membrane sensor domain MASE1